MATRRKRTKGKAGNRRPARRAVTRSAGARARKSRRASGGRGSGARTAKASTAAREVRQRARHAAAGSTPTTEHAPETTAPGPTLRLADPPVVEQGTGRSGDGREVADRSEWADREAAELARKIEAAVGSAGDTLRVGPEHAADRLGSHREQMEEAARREEEARDLPGAAALGLELAIGALRLVRSLAFAPLRLGLAFLRRGDALA